MPFLALFTLIVAIVMKFTSPGPVFFRQERIGYKGRRFKIYKFRTMKVGADTTVHQAYFSQLMESNQPMVKMDSRGDARLIPGGWLLRASGLDELPQLFNVLRGDMSLVGPRPHAPGTCAAGTRFEEVTQLYTARHRVKPGMTGLAQVRGWRGETDTLEKFLHRIDSDLEYIETWCLALDLRIICRTVFTVLRMRNAY